MPAHMSGRVIPAAARALCACVCLLAHVAAFAAAPLGCVIEPERTADVGAPVVGVIESMRVDRGDAVAAGQVLAVLRADIEQANLQVAETRARLEADVAAAAANLQLAQQKRARSEEMHAAEFISKQALEQAIAEHEVAVQKLAQAKEQAKLSTKELAVARAHVGLRTVRSPFAGVIVERYANPGERVEEKPILRVAMIDPLRVEVLLPVAQYGTIKPGDRVKVTPELPNASTIVARVSRVDKVVDSASNSFRVRLSMPNPGNKLPAGLRCNVELPLAANAGGTVGKDAAQPKPRTAPQAAPARPGGR
ncbi:MAG TPA: efflux RND transporter periplasmic adaptor subunit [Burkholderiales bacterium]|nr:efflux RND transporter periplasmic adaptor subunit [Burkholderiales bacterium]